MNTFEAISDRIQANRNKIGFDAQLRFTLTGLSGNGKVRTASDGLIDALVHSLRTSDQGSIHQWVASESTTLPSFQLRELAHAVCMAIAGDTAQFARESFRELMQVLQGIERAIASLVSTPEALQSAA